MAGVCEGQGKGAGRSMTTILVVDDSKFFLSVLSSKLRSAGFSVIGAASIAEARVVLETRRDEIFMALLDLFLPDGPEGEVVDLAISFGVPSVVFTGNYSEDTRDRVLSKRVIDYVVKDDPSSLDYLTSLVHRLDHNRSIRAMVVDDATTARKYIADLLALYQFQVVEATNGEQALQRLADTDNIRLVITDYHMPVMDGFQLIKNIRKTWRRDQVAVIGVSSSGSSTLSAKFIKSGANDFLNKPFLREEFFCRIAMNVDLMEQVDALKAAATTDYLTGIPNRRSFFERAQPLLAAAQRGQAEVAVALIDLDHFKSINDSHGHETGDTALATVARLLVAECRQTDLVARFGGEEFCVLAFNLAGESRDAYFERLRSRISDLNLDFNGQPITLSASIGVSSNVQLGLDGMIAEADQQLYRAKQEGRNRVCWLD
ncbi:Response regulator receiver modulated diguanylate cyclase [Magnetospirillum gryphiswaldense MSR-1 v2]|uniref:diguanylate cyclase n=2 Tax=Magnetospirillum gryphiswaldense TaxID=55518 RepID=V6F6G5_MAGGM|nr:Response regulator receiver modulated diguanylate cyclase [Magnetospirillum gryphiswaldense MSR-1 v2]